MLRITGLILPVLFLCQVAFAYTFRGHEPYWSVLPPVPTAQALDAQAFGDSQFLYRLLVMDLQNFGDTGGHLTPLKDYDMGEVVRWLEVLDRLDIDANHHITLAARYFSQTQAKTDLPQLVQYISDHVSRNPRKKFQWLSSAIFIAQVRIQDRALALKLADQLGSYDFPEMSLVAHQLPAVMHETSGDFAAAADHMQRALDRLSGRATPAEIEEMKTYVQTMRQRALAGGDGP